MKKIAVALILAGAVVSVGVGLVYQPREEVPSATVTSSSPDLLTSFEREFDGINLRGRILLSESLRRGSETVRVAAVVLEFTQNGETAGACSMIRPVGTESTESFFLAGPVGAAGTQRLNGRVEIRPATGRNWGQVDSGDALSITASSSD